MSDDLILEILVEGRDAVMRGWTQGSLVEIEGPERRVCALGALHGRCGHYVYDQQRWTAMEQAHSYLVQALPADASGFVPLWNDEPGRTQADVVALYDRAIKMREADLAA